VENSSPPCYKGWGLVNPGLESIFSFNTLEIIRPYFNQDWGVFPSLSYLLVAGDRGVLIHPLDLLRDLGFHSFGHVFW
jgi:hypothetical protein